MPPEFPGPVPVDRVSTLNDENINSHFGQENVAHADGGSVQNENNYFTVDPALRDSNMSELVISGISGKFPESENMQEFRDNLFNGIDMVTDDNRRFTPGLYGLPTRQGKLKNLDKFDSNFFGVHSKQANVMDPQLRILLQLTHEAILDAGVNPATIRGSRTGVFIGVSSSESAEAWTEDPEKISGYELTGTCRGMFANRISYTFDFKGPSYAIDTACSSSLLALENAVSAIRSGHCDSAIVGGVNLCLKPTTSLQFHRLGMLSPDGKCKAFDASANGYVRSEAAVVIYIRQAHQAVRSYATILHAKTNTDGHKNEGITFPSGNDQKRLLQRVYTEAGISPRQVAYVEAHGTGTKVGDPNEVNAMAEIFCKGRDPSKPLLIGSVKTNMGHSEPASGLCSIAKIILAMQEGIIPANLHFKNPNPEIPALVDGRLQVVHKNEHWDGGIVGVNSFGFGGANVHVILKSNSKKKCISSSSNENSSSSIPLLIPFSGRTHQSVEFALSELKKKPKDCELGRILQELAHQNIAGHNYRGFTIIHDDDHRPGPQIDTEISQTFLEGPVQTRPPPIWFIFSGMGTQWPRMGCCLLKFPIFEKSIKKSANVLKNNGLDLLDILMSEEEDDKIFDHDVIKSFVGIAAIQVALVDLLRSLQIFPHGIVGHSVGELGCAYADGCLTAEQTVLTAFARGKSIQESNLVVGGMAAVGLSWEEAKSKCPADIYPACHNSKDSITISGPSKKIKEFTESLTQQGIFARQVNSAGQAFHSPYMKEAGPTLKNYLEKIIPEPKPRSDRWVSSSVSPVSNVVTTGAKVEGHDIKFVTFDPSLASADYFVNNLLSPVLFHEALIESKVPENAVLIEVAPHCLLQAILRRSLPQTKSILGVMNKGVENGLDYFVKCLGKIYNFGLNPNVHALYENVEFPVSMETPMISPLIQWDHGDCWDVPNFDPKNSATSNNTGSIVFEIDLDTERDHFYVGHKVDGRILFPAAGYIVLAWKAFSMRRPASSSGPIINFDQLPIVMENLVIHRATVLEPGTPLKFSITLLPHSGQFQIEESNSIVVSGHIREPASGKIEQEMTNLSLKVESDADSKILNSLEVYKMFRLMGLEVAGEFKSVHRLDMDNKKAEVIWTGNWVTYFDSLLQLNSLYKTRRSMNLPTGIQKLVINPAALLLPAQRDSESIEDNKCHQTFSAVHHQNLKVAKCLGVEMRGISTSSKERRSDLSPTLQKYEFTPFFDHSHVPVLIGQKKNIMTNKMALRFCVSIVLDNLSSSSGMGMRRRGHLDVLEFLEAGTNPVSEFVDHCISLHLPKTTSKIIVRARIGDFQSSSQNDKEAISSDLLIVHRETFLVSMATGLLKPNSFILFDGSSQLSSVPGQLQMVASKISNENRHFCLLRVRRQVAENSGQILIKIDSSNFDWLDQLKGAMQESTAATAEIESEIISKKIYLVSTSGPVNGIMGLALSLMQEPGGNNIRCLFVQDENIFFENLEKFWQSPELNIIDLDLTMNIFKNGVWGSYCHYELMAGIDLGGLHRVEHASLKILKTGDLSSLRWIESPLKFFEKNNSQNIFGQLCDVYYAPLNFRDIMLSLGKIPLDVLPCQQQQQQQQNQGPVFGLEFSGICKKSGKRIMALAAQDQGLATTALAEPDFIWEVPSEWTLAEAATVPTVYCTVFYALVIRGRIQPRDSILIHSGAGGVGQAAIGVALSMNCQVFTTVGSPEKKNLLQKLFPALEDRHFANSRDTSFEQHILKETGGHGVDLILNSLAGDKLQASIRCLAVGGKFLEIGKADIAKDVPMGMGHLIKNVDIMGVHLDHLLRNKRSPDRQKMAKLMTQGLTCGLVRPLQRTIFSLDEIEPAFRFMASGKHTGKVVIQIRRENQQPVSTIQNSKFSINAIPQSYFSPEKIYILIGGLGGVGLELSQWLIDRGARKLVLVGRSGVTTAYQKMCMREWMGQNGVSVVICQTDVSVMERATNFLQKIGQELDGQIGGIFNLAMVLRDSLLENQSVGNFEEVCRPKIEATKNLDHACRQLGHYLDHFVIFSSVAAAKGNPGQSNYSFANSWAERICEARRKDGLAGLAIQWGAIGDVGVIFDQMNLDNETVIGGTRPQRIRSCLNTLDEFLIQEKYSKNPNCAVYSSWVYHHGDQDKGCKSNGTKTSLIDDIGHILGMKEISKVNKGTQLSDLGMDSLMSMEVKLLLERHHQSVPTDKIGQLTLTDLMEIERENLTGYGSSNSDLDNNSCEFSMKKLDPGSIVWMAEELMPSSAIVKMESATNEHDDEDNTPIFFFIHPIDGFVVAMEKLAARLNATVYGLQCTKEAPLESIEKLATFYIEKIRKVLKKPGPINLVAYSYGGPIACEMAIHLEKFETVGKIIFLDSSYKLLEEDRAMDQFTGLEMETPDADAVTFCYFMLCFMEFEYGKLRDHLSRIGSFEGRLCRTVELLSPALPKFSLDEVRNCVHSFYDKVAAATKYRPIVNGGQKIGGTKVVLIKIRKIDPHQHDYGLTEVFDGPVEVHEVGGTHVTMVTREPFVDDIAQIINQTGYTEG